MSEQNSYVIEVDGTEYELEALADEIVVMNFSRAFGHMIGALRGSAQSLTEFMRPHEPLFSFAGTPELRALIFTANEYYDRHDETADEGLAKRITELATPHIKAWRRAEGKV